jgi:hypothetical protein
MVESAQRGHDMKLYVVYDDSNQATQEELALKALCLELQKMYVANYLKTITIDPQAPDIERVIQAITTQKETSFNGSI